MTEKDLKRMGRRELMEIIAAQKSLELELRERLEKAEQALNDRTIEIAKAGSIAEAAISVNQVFAAAQAAADDYLRSIENANAQVESRISQAEAERARILENAEQEAQARIQDAEAEIQQKWTNFQANVDRVLHSSPELSIFLNETKDP